MTASALVAAGSGALAVISAALAVPRSGVEPDTRGVPRRRERGRRYWPAGLVVAVVADLRLGLVYAIALRIRPILVRRRLARRHEAAVMRELPELIDLVRLALSSGGTVLLAVQAVAAHPVGPLSSRFADVVVSVARGHRLADAVESLSAEMGEPVRPLVRALVSSERYGVALGPTLERLAAEAREDRRRRVQTVARKVPVRMLLPLVLGVLPAFVLLTLVPTIAASFDGLDLGR